jgi:hypothetical protein
VRQKVLHVYEEKDSPMPSESYNLEWSDPLLSLPVLRESSMQLSDEIQKEEVEEEKSLNDEYIQSNEHYELDIHR